MGRFFQAQPIQLSKDNIYQPPLELMMAANQYKNQEIQQTGENAQILLDSLDFRHQQIDDENAKNITKEISDKVNKAVEVFNKDLSSPEARRMLNSLKDEIKTRYTSGDIYNVQKTNDNLVAFEKELENNKNLKEIDKQRHRAYFNNWVKQNPEGSLKGYFTPGNIIEDKDTLTEYTKFHNANKPDIEAKTRETIGNRWNTLTDNQKEILVFENGYRDFINATPALKDMLKTQMTSGLYDDRNIKFDEKDNLDMTQGFGLNMLPSTKALDYTRELKDSITKSVNPYENIDFERAYRANKDREEKVISDKYGTNTDVRDRILKSNNIATYRDLRIQQIINALPKNIQSKIIDQKDLIKYTKGIKGLEKLHQEALNLEEEITKTTKASFDYFAKKGGEKEASQKATEFNKNVKANYTTLRLSLAPKEVENFNIPIYQKDKNGKNTKVITGYKKGRQSVVNKAQYDNFYPSQSIGQIRYLPNGRKIRVQGIEYVENSAEPIILNSPETTGISINNNDAKINIKYTGVLLDNEGKDTKVVQSYQQRAYFDMSKGVGLEKN